MNTLPIHLLCTIRENRLRQENGHMRGPRRLQLGRVLRPAVIFGVVTIDVSQVAVLGIAPLLTPGEEKCPHVRYDGRPEYCLGEDISCQCIKVARRQNLIPSFPWIAPGWRAWGCNPRKGRDQILQRSVAEP